MAETRLLELQRDGRLTLPGLRLVVQRGPDRGRAVKIEKEECVIGTATSTDLCLTDPAVSRNHAVLRAQPDGYLLIDLESKNGTRLGGHRIRQAYAEAGDVIEVGESRLRFEATRGEIELRISPEDCFGPLIGRSVAARRLFALLEAVAPEESTVLLLGETGTGKDVAAEALHRASPRREGPFVVVDCGSIPPGLVESELFGHDKGAFTGADARRIGAFEEANGGTLFLDEVGELPRPAQAKLLRALERREVRPVGSDRVRPVDVRIVAATNRDLRVEVNRGQFREDLYYRLAVIAVRVPPLRERREDVPLLAEHFRRQLSGDRDGALAESWLESLATHAWPGNVRELRNRVEQELSLPGAGMADLSPIELSSFGEAKEKAIAEFERAFFSALLSASKGNVSEAARRAKMDRVHLWRLLRKYGIKGT